MGAALTGNVADRDILKILEKKNGTLRAGRENILHQIARMLGHSNRGNDASEQIREQLLRMQSRGQIDLEYDSVATQRIVLIRLLDANGQDDDSLAIIQALKAELVVAQQEIVSLKTVRQADAELVESAQALIATAEQERDTAIVAAEAARAALEQDHRRAKDIRRIRSLSSQLADLQTRHSELQAQHRVAQLASTRRIENLQATAEACQKVIAIMNSHAESLPCGCKVARVVNDVCELGGDHEYVMFVPGMVEEHEPAAGLLSDLLKRMYDDQD